MLAAGGLIVATIGLVLNIVGVTIPYWYYYSEVEMGVKSSVYFGLWKLCMKAEAFGQTGTGCRNFDDFGLEINLPTELEAARGLELTAILLIATTIVIGGVKVVMKKGDERNFKVAGGLACASGIFMLGGAIAFSTSDEVKTLNGNPIFALIPFKLHAGFAMCIVSGVLSFAAAVMLFLENDGENRTLPQHVPHPGQTQGRPAASQ